MLLVASTVLIFVGTSILPGDVAQAILGQSATPEALENLRQRNGAERTGPVNRYFSWVGGILQGDLGTALTNGADISPAQSKSGLGNTLFLAFWAAIISVPLAITVGGCLGQVSQPLAGQTDFRCYACRDFSARVYHSAISFMFLIAVKLRWVPSVSLINDSDEPGWRS